MKYRILYKTTSKIKRELKEKTFLLLVLIFLLISCREETTYQLQILIKNETENELSLKLYPKQEFLKGDLYKISDYGDYTKTENEIEPNDKCALYLSVDLTRKPYMLASEIFDSILIIPIREDEIEMKFTQDTVIGYSENLFDETSNWNYEILNYNEPTNFTQNPVESHNYSFSISDEK